MTKKLKDLEALVSRLEKAQPPAYSNHKFHRGQNYDHVVQVSKRTLNMIIWCNENCKDNYSLDLTTMITFVNPRDAMLFKLTWGGDL